MRRVACSLFIILTCLATVWLPDFANAAWWSSGPLITINSQDYTTDDFKSWWTYWNNGKDAPFPESLEDYLNFQLMVQQGRAMEYDKQPQYLRKLQVFLKVRSLMALKREEIDSKIDISDEDLKANFDQNYSPIWFLQILTFENSEKAEAAYADLSLKSIGPAGRLIFADYQGILPEQGGPIAYDEVQVTPEIIRKNRPTWEDTVRNLAVGEISKPFAVVENGHKILIRLNEITTPPLEQFEQKKELILNNIYKQRRDQLTRDLLQRLSEIYKVVIDEELYEEIDSEKEYSDDYLDKIVITMVHQNVTVRDFISNIKRESKVRGGSLSPLDIKGIIRGNILSQTLIDKAAIDRHYENEEPLKGIWSFYQDNRLRLAVEVGIKNKIKIDENEIQSYYQEHKADYSKPERLRYILIADEPELIQKMWSGLLLGSDFDETVKKYDKEFDILSKAKTEISSEVLNVLNKLTRGEFSNPFTYEGGSAIVKLLEEIPSEVDSLDKVRSTILTTLKDEMFEQQKQNYLDELRSRSQIHVNEKMWLKLKES
ncbi:MAG: peptidyl-prolyl cis-trans isomerase [Proteobacteria bacterium]|nr:peptidyl-prolyl cis-trans isomerase [Pseudomonadota bacterium]MBU1688466.1 peptidyl-prolyl cis-trans isomerase [Pseudomonadota bacterium]